MRGNDPLRSGESGVNARIVGGRDRCCADLPRRRAIRNLGGAPRAPDRRPVPVAGGRRRPADQGVVRHPGRACSRLARRAPGPRGGRRADAVAAVGGLGLGPGVAGGTGVLHPPPARPGVRRPARARGRRLRARAAGRHRDRPLRPDDPGRVVPQPGGRQAGLPGLGRRRRRVAAARHRRGHRRAHRGADRPLPLHLDRVAARWRGVLLRPAPAQGVGARGRGAVPPPGVAPPGGRRPGAGPARARRGPAPHVLLRHVGVPGRPVAVRARQPGHRAPRLGVDRRPLRRCPGARAAPRPRHLRRRARLGMGRA